MRNSIIVPSIASCNQLRIEEEVKYAEKRANNLHIDIEDGNFIPNITFGVKMIKAIRSITRIPFSVHLMVENPLDYIEILGGMNCSHIFIHVEKQMYLSKIISKVKKYDIKVGIALNPISRIENFEYLINEVDAILYLTAEPDDDGENFKEAVLNKVKLFSHKEIWIDGGVTHKRLPELNSLGITHVVMGRAFFEGGSK